MVYFHIAPGDQQGLDHQVSAGPLFFGRKYLNDQYSGCAEFVEEFAEIIMPRQGHFTKNSFAVVGRPPSNRIEHRE